MFYLLIILFYYYYFSIYYYSFYFSIPFSPYKLEIIYTLNIVSLICFQILFFRGSGADLRLCSTQGMTNMKWSLCLATSNPQKAYYCYGAMKETVQCVKIYQQVTNYRKKQ